MNKKGDIPRGKPREGPTEEVFEKEEEGRQEIEGAAQNHPSEKLRSRGFSQSR
jgi:hypothetical protein